MIEMKMEIKINPQIKELINRATFKGLIACAETIAGEAKKNAGGFIDRGLLMNQIKTIPYPEEKRVDVVSFAPYSQYVEFGTGPHKTSQGSYEFKRAIRDWCERHGLLKIWHAVVRAIRRRGPKHTAKNEFMRNALYNSYQRLNEILAADLDKTL